MYAPSTECLINAGKIADFEARRYSQNSLKTEHYLIGLFGVKEGIASAFFRNIDLRVEIVRPKIEELAGINPEDIIPGEYSPISKTPMEDLRDMLKSAIRIGEFCLIPSPHVHYALETRTIIEYGLEEVRNLNHEYLGTMHVLLGLLKEQEGVGGRVLRAFGVDFQKTLESLLKLHEGLKEK